ncbi:MAG: FHA domain-containing protein [Candidatus Eremiobacteraeota bacterium]|nr:FHA domain-containing protein [Candidatus Eremiobacteraeota bacterium]
MLLLEVLSGPLDGKTWSFDREITIGRDDSLANACITIDRYISRKHARLWESEGLLFVADLNSRNGTKVDGQPIRGDAMLQLGAAFMVGRTLLRVTRI